MDIADARRLRAATDADGIAWRPRSGDRFVIPDRDLDESVFVLSEMTINVERAIGGDIIKFNGTTEWALDSIAASEVLWLPREDQLRELLGVRFTRLEALGEPAGGFAVTLDDGRRFVHVDAERAYLLAVLAVLDAG